MAGHGWGLVLAVLLVPGAAAEMTATATVDPPAIEPDRGVAQLTVHVEIPCADLVATPGAIGRQALHVEPTSPEPGLTIGGPRTFEVPQDACTADPLGSVSLDPVFTVSAASTAAGLVPLPIHVAVHMPKGNPAAEDQEATASASVTSNYFPSLAVRVDEKVQEVAPGATATYTFQISNHGNADTTLVASVAPEAALAVEGLGPIAVPRGQDVTWEARIPTQDKFGWDNREASVTIVFTPHATADMAQAGDPLTASLLVRVRSGTSGEAGDAAPPLHRPAAGVGPAGNGLHRARQAQIAPHLSEPCPPSLCVGAGRGRKRLRPLAGD